MSEARPPVDPSFEALPERGRSRPLDIEIGGRMLLFVFAGLVLLVWLAFHFGRRLGREEGVQLGAGGAPQSSGVLAEESAGTDLTFFDDVGEQRSAGPPPPVASGAPPETAPARPATSAAPTPAAPRPTPSASGRYEVQVAVASERLRAESLAAGLRAKGYRPVVSTASSGGRTVWRVRVGGYEDLNAARAAAARLEREEGLQTWIPGAR